MDGEFENNDASIWGQVADEELNYIQEKGFENPLALVKSYQELEKNNADKIALPDGDDDEEWGKIYSKLGRPEEAEKYELEWRDEDKEFAPKIKEAFYKAGVSNKGAVEVYAAFLDVQKDIQEQMSARSQAEIKEIEQAWGKDLVKNQEISRRGQSLLGLDDDAFAKVEMLLGTKNLIGICLNLGNAISEDAAKGLGASKETGSQEMSTEAYITEILNNAKGS